MADLLTRAGAQTKAVFLAALHNVHITEPLGEGDRINDTLRVTNDPAVISRFLSPEYRGSLGRMEVNSLLAGGPVVFADGPLPPGMTAHEYLLSRLYEVQAFLMTTWIFEDNAINCELGFVLYEEHAGTTVSSNFIAHLYATARREKPVSKFSRERLREIRAAHRMGMVAPDHPFALPTSQLTTSHTRISRALYILNSARGEPDAALRVAHYCTALEALFTSSQAELAHQLAERIAWYISQDAEDRLENYRRIKAAYGLRSRTVHGSGIRAESLDEALELSEYCDGVARRLYQRFLSEPGSRALFNAKTDKFEQDMLKLVLGHRPDKA